jgi:hypothetical protein
MLRDMGGMGSMHLAPKHAEEFRTPLDGDAAKLLVFVFDDERPAAQMD